MRFALAKNWWSLVIRGFLGILVGVLTFMWPHFTLTMLVFLFAGYALVDGVVDLAGAFRAVAAGERWGALLLEGMLGIAAAVVTVLWPAITAFGLVIVIGAWAIITGFLEIAAAIRLRKHIRGEVLLLLGGIASVIFGIFVIAMPLAGALVISLWFGAYAFVFGVLLVALGFRLRNWDHVHFAGGGIPQPAH